MALHDYVMLCNTVCSSSPAQKPAVCSGRFIGYTSPHFRDGIIPLVPTYCVGLTERRDWARAAAGCYHME
jgi:hypothetical protein